jgi:hypothetical protein
MVDGARRDINGRRWMEKNNVLELVLLCGRTNE